MLAIILASQLMIILDASVVITALPQIRLALNFSAVSLSWVLNAYTLAFGGFLLFGARAGDIMGRRRVFIGAVGVFTVASLLGGLARSSEWLLLARAAQGIAAAFAAPSTLALLMISFREGHERARALSLYTAVTGAGGAVGLVLGGALTDLMSCRWVLFINLPIGVVLLVLAPLYLPETERHRGRFDLTGALTGTLSMTALVHGFIRAVSEGWSDWGTIVSFAAGALLLGAFILTEMRAEQPITPLYPFVSTERSGAYISRMLLVGALFGTFFFLSQYVQEVLGYSALKAGFAFLPLTIAQFGTVVYGVRRLLPRIGNSWLIVGGLLVALLGMGCLSLIAADSQYFPQIAVPLVILGAGTGAAFVPLTAAGIAGVAARDAGAASGLVNVAHQAGGSLGVAILITVFGMASRNAAGQPLAGAPAAMQTRYELVHAISMSITASAALLALALLVTIATSHRPRASQKG